MLILTHVTFYIYRFSYFNIERDKPLIVAGDSKHLPNFLRPSLLGGTLEHIIVQKCIYLDSLLMNRCLTTSFVFSFTVKSLWKSRKIKQNLIKIQKQTQKQENLA